MTKADVLAALPETITVYGYRHQTVDDRARIALTGRVLEQLFEELEKEYGDPNGGDHDPTDKARQAARALIDVALEEFRIWACDKVCEEEVNVQAWVKEHRPDWLE